MCVIFAVSKTRPTDEQIEKAYNANPRGAGIAWRDTVDGRTVVRWKKGMDLKESQEMTRKVPMPFVIHFRIPSIGPDKPQFNHPFPISANVELALEGQTDGSVLFHNGTWSGWREIRTLAHFYGAKIPLGDWSDSRAMAFAAYLGGLGELTFIDERVIAFGPNLLEIFNHKAWTRVDEGFWASNNGWSMGKSYTGGASNTTTNNSAKASATVLLPGDTDDDDDTKPVVKSEQAGGTAQPTTFRSGPNGDATQRSVSQVFGGGNQQADLQDSEALLHGSVERHGESERSASGNAELIASMQELRDWTATLNPKKYGKHVH